LFTGSIIAPGHYGDHPRPQVADRGTPSRKDKMVAPTRNTEGWYSVA